MSARLNPRRLALRLVAVTWIAAAGLMGASCGRRLPTAPVAVDAGAASRLGAGAPAAAGAASENEVCVTVVPGTDVNALATDYGATVVGLEEWRCVTLLPPSGMLPDTLAARMVGDPRVETSERNGPFEDAEARQQSFGFDDGLGSLTTAGSQRSVGAAGLREAHQVSLGEGILVAILDNGIDRTHPLFAGRIAGGWDCVDNDPDPADVTDGIDQDGDGSIDEAYGHGTHVAGIVALAAPRARLLVVRVLDADGIGDMRTVAAGIRWARMAGARVINLSLGSLRSSDAVQDALDEAAMAGILTVASAGNWGAASPQEYPARSSHVLAVAASDSRRRATSFTSYGSFVSITAPGDGVRSAYPGNRWMQWSGTSMSAPFVSGTAALLLAVHPGWGEGQVRARLESTAAPVVPLHPAMDGNLGTGALDAGAALSADHPGPGAPGGEDPIRLPSSR